MSLILTFGNEAGLEVETTVRLLLHYGAANPPFIAAAAMD